MQREMTKRKQKKAQPLTDEAATSGKFAEVVSGTVFLMEKDVSEAINYARALMMIGETLDKQEGLIVCQLAHDILDRLDAIEEKRAKIFKSSHPNRVEFEKTGWPGESTLSGVDTSGIN